MQVGTGEKIFQANFLIRINHEEWKSAYTISTYERTLMKSLKRLGRILFKLYNFT